LSRNQWVLPCVVWERGARGSPLAYRPDTHSTTTPVILNTNTLTPHGRKTTYLHLLAVIARWCTPACPSLPPVHYFQRILGVALCPSLPDHTRQHPLLATPTSTATTTTCLDYLHLHAETMRPSTRCRHTSTPALNGLGVVPCPSLPDQTHTTPQLRLNWRSHAQKTICVQLLSNLVTARASA